MDLCCISCFSDLRDLLAFFSFLALPEESLILSNTDHPVMLEQPLKVEFSSVISFDFSGHISNLKIYYLFMGGHTKGREGNSLPRSGMHSTFYLGPSWDLPQHHAPP